MQKQWLKDWPWDTVVTINVGLCKEKETPFQPNPKGYATAEKLWTESRHKEMTLHETLMICRRCHQLSPFSFYNGNTFAAIGRILVQDILRHMPPDRAHAFRSIVGHYIAGTAEDPELEGALAALKGPVTNDQ